MFTAILVGIFRFKEIDNKLGPFVQFKARLDKRESIDDDDEIAVLQIQGTESYHILFLDSYKTKEEIQEELKEADAKINHTTLKILEGHL